jgi:hypothetical protein
VRADTTLAKSGQKRGDRVSAPAASWCDPAGASPLATRNVAAPAQVSSWHFATQPEPSNLWSLSGSCGHRPKVGTRVAASFLTHSCQSTPNFAVVHNGPHDVVV